MAQFEREHEVVAFEGLGDVVNALGVQDAEGRDWVVVGNLGGFANSWVLGLLVPCGLIMLQTVHGRSGPSPRPAPGARPRQWRGAASMRMRAIDRAPASGATVRIVRHGNDTTAGRELVVAPAGTPASGSAEFADEQLTATTATWLYADSMSLRENVGFGFAGVGVAFTLSAGRGRRSCEGW